MKKLISISLLFLLCLLKCTQINATILTAGDIAFTGYSSSGYSQSINSFSFVVLKDLSSGTVIYFTDKGWLGSGSFRPGETIIGWVSPVVARGTEIFIKLDSAFTKHHENSTGVVCGSVLGSPLILNSDGDQIFAFQGTEANPTFISGLHYNITTTSNGGCAFTNNTNWDGACANDINSSFKPAALTTGMNAILISDGTSFDEYNAGIFLSNDSLYLQLSNSQLNSMINNKANWQKNQLSFITQFIPLPSGLFLGPEINIQPKDDTVHAGRKSFFSGTVNTSNLTQNINGYFDPWRTYKYQWQYLDGTSFVDYSSPTFALFDHPNSNNPDFSLEIIQTPISFNNYKLRCKITDITKHRTTVTDTINLRVYDSIVFTQTTINHTICQGGEDSIQVTVTSPLPVTYAWQIYNPSLGFLDADMYPFTGGNSSKLLINELSPGTYYINSNVETNYTNNHLGAPYISATVTVTVNPSTTQPSLLSRIPATSFITQGANVSALFNAGSGGVSCLDEYRYTLNGGATYLSYTPGNAINTGGLANGSYVFIEGRRANCASGCNGNWAVLTSWYVNPLPTTPTILSAGDIAFTGYDSDNDKFSFVLLKSIGAGTVINFTDKGWFNSINAFGSSESVITWTSNTAMLAGEEIYIVGLYAYPINSASLTGISLDLSDAGDQILAYQGSATTPVFISAIHMNVQTGGNATTSTVWDTGNNTASNRSNLPPGLTNAVNAIWMGDEGNAESEYDNAVFAKCNNYVEKGDMKILRTALNYKLNWAKSNTSLNPDFPIPTGCNYLLPYCQTISLTNGRTDYGLVGQAFTKSCTQSGAFQSWTYTTSSTLPSGITLSAAGVFSGSPSNYGIFPIEISIIDINGCQGVGYDTLVIFNNTSVVSSCLPASTNACQFGDLINYFSLKGIISTIYNNSGNNCPALNPGYNDYSNTYVTTLAQGNTYSGFIQSSRNDNYATIWIDFNDNGIFENGERLLNNLKMDSVKKLYGIYIPINAIVGIHRMRVRCTRSTTPPAQLTDPCALYTYGETEDYKVCILNNEPMQVVSPGILDQCLNAAEMTISEACNNVSTSGMPYFYVPIVDSSNQLIASIMNYYNIGTFKLTVFVKSGSLRKDLDDHYYLNRNFKMESDTQYNFASRIRVYIKNSELTGIIAQPGSNVTSLYDLKPTHSYEVNPASCQNQISPNCFCEELVDYSITYGNVGFDNYINIDAVKLEGSIYLHGGTTALSQNAKSVSLVPTYSTLINQPFQKPLLRTDLFDPVINFFPGQVTTSMTLPAGVTLSSQGILSGTPTEFGTFVGTVNVNSFCAMINSNYTFALTITCPQFTVNPISNIVSCSGNTIQPIEFVSNEAGASFQWTNSNTAIGLASSGLGDIPGFQPINTGNTTLASTITVTPVYTSATGTCNGTPITFTISVLPCTTYLNLKCFLQGYFTAGNNMNSVLYNQGKSATNTSCDSITMELRNPYPPYSLIYTTSIILSTTGLTSFYIPITNGSYYIVLKHRNSIETWSAAPITISPITNYDFTTSANQAYGSNQIEIENGVWSIYSGDINQDENIDLLDASLLEVDINNFEFGYFSTDINGDGNVDLLDTPIVESNINNFIFALTP